MRNVALGFGLAFGPWLVGCTTVTQISGGLSTTAAGVNGSTGGAVNVHVEQGVAGDDSVLAAGGGLRGRFASRMQAVALAPSLSAMWSVRPMSVYGRVGPELTLEKFDSTFYASPGGFAELGVGVPLSTKEVKRSDGTRGTTSRLLLTLSGTLEYDIRATRRDDAFASVLLGLAYTSIPSL